MADYFAETILEASLGYVEFPVSERKLGVGRRISRTEYPYRKGQGIEELGQKAATFTLTVPLFRGLSEDYYPDTYQRLIAVLEDDDQRGGVEYIDPELGPVQVQILDYDVDLGAQRRDGVQLSITLEERGFDASLLSGITQPKLAGASRASLFAAEVDQEVAALDVPDAEKPPFSLTDTWRTFQESLDAGAMAADQIAAQLDEVFMVCRRFLDFSAADEIQRWSLFNSIIDFAGAAEDAANESSGPATIEVVLHADMSAYDIATYFFDDATRAEEIIQANPTNNPMRYARGTHLRVAPDAQTPTERPGYGAQR